MTTRQTIERWFDEGAAKGSAFMVIMCDTFDHSDYPVYCSTAQVAKQRVRSPGEMQRAMEVYDLAGDKLAQMKATRAWALTD